MTDKQNEATVNRPSGHRIIDAPSVFVNLDHYAQIVKAEKAWKENDRNAITLFKSGELTVLLTLLKTEASMKHIQVDGYTSIQLLSGSINIISEESEKEANDGDFIVFHPGFSYSIFAKTESALLMTHFNVYDEKDKII